jgi:hypothetical protein
LSRRPSPPRLISTPNSTKAIAVVWFVLRHSLDPDPTVSRPHLSQELYLCRLNGKQRSVLDTCSAPPWHRNSCSFEHFKQCTVYWCFVARHALAAVRYSTHPGMLARSAIKQVRSTSDVERLNCGDCVDRIESILTKVTCEWEEKDGKSSVKL